MAIISSYPTITPTSSDLVLVVDTSEDGNPTKTATVGSINASATAPDILTATVLVTDAQLRTLGTTPVDILPGVAGYIYEILGITTFAKNSGGNSASYNWSASGDGVFYGQGFAAVDHRLEVPNAQLPAGGFNIDASAFVGTPIAGRYRIDAALRLSTTLGVDPTPVLSPNATWIINVTYRLIQSQ
jgi:hypothetical protein